jgi:hypothetical protein
MKTFKHYLYVTIFYVLVIILLIPEYVFIFGLFKTGGLKALLLKMSINMPIGTLLLLFIPMLFSVLMVALYFAKKAIDMQTKRDNKRFQIVIKHHGKKNFTDVEKQISGIREE